MRLIDADTLKIDYGFTWDDITPSHEELYALIDRQPTIEPERKRGKWVHGREIGRDKIGDCIIAIFYNGWECSSCGCLVEESREPLYKFCPQCGADMREE